MVRPRTRRTCVLGRTHVCAKSARTDVGRLPRAIYSRNRHTLTSRNRRCSKKAGRVMSAAVCTYCLSFPMLAASLPLSLSRFFTATAWLVSSLPLSRALPGIIPVGNSYCRPSSLTRHEHCPTPYCTLAHPIYVALTLSSLSALSQNV